MAKTIKAKSKKLQRRDLLIKRITRVIIILFLILLFFYIIIGSMFKGGRFFIAVDPNFSLETGIFMYDNKEIKNNKPLLYVDEIDFNMIFKEMK